ncbi:MAG: tRNA (adenosine(37)-N6)-threonylcarbamoyltransferase complex ATPase subunit type 1 TsaE [Candidatus Omnitrophota bacterium]
MQIISQSVNETRALGKRIAQKLKSGDIICFYGDLGSGKTTMIKGIAEGLRLKPDYIHSPTFTLLNIYEHGRLPLFHFDMYRIDDPKDLFDIGYEEFLYGKGISVIEWSEKFGCLLPGERLEIHLKHKGDSRRTIQIKAAGQYYEKLMKRIGTEAK